MKTNLQRSVQLIKPKNCKLNSLPKISDFAASGFGCFLYLSYSSTHTVCSNKLIT